MSTEAYCCDLDISCAESEAGAEAEAETGDSTSTDLSEDGQYDGWLYNSDGYNVDLTCFNSEVDDLPGIEELGDGARDSETGADETGDSPDNSIELGSYEVDPDIEYDTPLIEEEVGEVQEKFEFHNETNSSIEQNDDGESEAENKKKRERERESDGTAAA